jgi:hypothetical protein
MIVRYGSCGSSNVTQKLLKDHIEIICPTTIKYLVTRCIQVEMDGVNIFIFILN